MQLGADKNDTRENENGTKQNAASTPQTWAELIEWRANYPDIIHKWLQVMGRLILRTRVRDDDELGDLIVGCMFASHRDINDLMTLSHTDSHHGAQYCLRALFERIVTLKYLYLKPEYLEDFSAYDAVDWDQIVSGIYENTGISMEPEARESLSRRAAELRKKNKQEKCLVCKSQRPASWTRIDSRQMAKQVGLDHLYLMSFTIPSKLMHPTLWGTRDRLTHNTPLYNTLHCMHHLLIEILMIHRRHFMGKQYVTPIMGNAILDFLGVYVYSQTSFDGVLRRGQERNGQRIYYGF
ncbi:hypothetical protein HNQ77_002011 [Silvibacterium bohemicum]|uniref:Uncharacterized protein n=1 Tax=Silvibacterium bohemicum TaxID=1577686 RepID=A0A841JWF5_9BACT|nr:DUF5677 domain-containing protein [Silvibacterium bohemicum]MBB6144059.1 hypothetical protein [Silvibacterium bohemicum]